MCQAGAHVLRLPMTLIVSFSAIAATITGSRRGFCYKDPEAAWARLQARNKMTQLFYLIKMIKSRAKSTKIMRPFFSCTVLMLLGTPAIAHEGAHTGGLLSGLSHPLAGADHLMAMVAAGLWVATQKPAARRWLPALFPLAMMLGALTAARGTALAGMESLIGLSVVVLGMLTVFSVRMPAWAGGLLLAVFALAHGQAHGQEMPADVSSLAYFIGFSATTALLHLGGMMVADHAGRLASRAAGLGIAMAGTWLMLG